MEHIKIQCKNEKFFERAQIALKISNIEFYTMEENELYICGQLKKKTVKKAMEDYNIKCKVSKEIENFDNF